MNIQYLSLEALENQKVRDLLEPEFKQWILKKENRENCLLLAAYINEDLAALLVVDHINTSATAHIQSFRVKPEYRRKGIATALIEKMETDLFHKQVLRITADFHESVEAESFLKKQGWAPPVYLFESFTFDLRIFNPPWYKNPPPLPTNYKFIRWGDLSENDLNTLETYGKTENLLISDYERNYPIEPLNSILLKIDDKIAGWMETHRMDKDTVNYSHLFLFPDHRFQGAAIPLLAESIHIQARSTIPIAFFELNLQYTPKAWQNFIRKRLKPYANQTFYTYYSNKLINMI